MTRYQAGEPDGLVDLQEALAFCRAHQLPSLRRATQDVGYALREEGDSVRAETLLREGGTVGAGAIIGGSTIRSADAMRALFAGDWDHFLALADLFLDTPTAEWNLQIRGVRGWMRAMRGDADGAAQDVAQALSTARSSGFWRLKWTALAHGALCHALLDQRDDSEKMLRELGEGWRRMRTIASAEWVAAAAHAAVRLGEDAAELLGEALADTPHHTAWSQAAISSLNGTLAAARGDYGTAALAHLDAAERYASAGTDRFLALGGAIRALSGADTPVTDYATPDSTIPDSPTTDPAIPDSRRARIPEPRVAAARAELTAFALRNHIVTAPWPAKPAEHPLP